MSVVKIESDWLKEFEARQQIATDVQANAKFRARVKEEKEIRQDHRDLDEQEARGNRIPYSSTYSGELWVMIIFLVVFIGFFYFVYNKIILIYGW